MSRVVQIAARPGDGALYALTESGHIFERAADDKHFGPGPMRYVWRELELPLPLQLRPEE